MDDKRATTSAPPPFIPRLFAAFEGGGAKGLVHIGALKALEERGFVFEGVAGTSAGAIIAALKAAGYSADELVNTDTRQTILDHYASLTGQRIGPTDFFGHGGWPIIKTIRILCNSFRAIVFVGFVVMAICFSLAWMAMGPAFATHLMSAIFAIFAIIITTAWFTYYKQNGLVSGRLLRSALNTLIAHKLFPEQPDRTPLLGDFVKNGRPSLRIVAADITGKTLRLFSSDDPADSEVPVADAVVASTCLPYIFKPWQINNRLHVDGGIVSNLPAWPFDEQRALDLDAVTIAFEISPNVDAQQNVNARWMTSIAETAVFGGAMLNKRAVDRLFAVTLETDLSLLDFDVPLERIISTVSDARKATDAKVTRDLIDIPQIYREGCLQIQKSALEILAELPVENLGARHRARVAFASKVNGFQNSARLLVCVGFENDADEGIILPLKGSVIGEAWKSAQPTLQTQPFPAITTPGYRRLEKLFAKDINWISATPIKNADESVAFVIAVDGSAPLSTNGNDLQEFLNILSGEIERVFVPIARASEF